MLGGVDTRLAYSGAALGVAIIALMVTLVATGGLAHLAGAAAALAIGWAVLGLIDTHKPVTRAVGLTTLVVSLVGAANAFVIGRHI